MFYLRYDDIEGLFRDAAENYQINTDKAFDWEKVSKGVQEEPDKENKPQPGKNNKRRFILWFLLLLSVSLLSYNLWTFQAERKWREQNIAEKNKGVAENKKLNAEKNPAQNESNELKKQEASSERSSANKNQTTQIIANNKSQQQVSKFTINSLHANEFDNADNYAIRSKESNADVNPISLKKPVALNDAPQELNKNISNLIQPIKNTSPIATSKKQVARKNTASKFYVGAFVAPDVTFIKFQQTNGVGATFGLTAGYQFNKKWSIETGISLDTKNYYTKGEYFTKDNIPYLSSAELLSVDGTCNMLEMPINIRYKFPSNANHNWTAAIGTSTYFMTKESYNYSVKPVWGNGTVQGKFTNYPSSTHLFAVINFSAGYEKKLNNLSLLIEPYYKAPVKGIGTGNLYMSSAGINVGVKKYFGK